LDGTKRVVGTQGFFNAVVYFVYLTGIVKYGNLLKKEGSFLRGGETPGSGEKPYKNFFREGVKF